MQPVTVPPRRGIRRPALLATAGRGRGRRARRRPPGRPTAPPVPELDAPARWNPAGLVTACEAALVADWRAAKDLGANDWEADAVRFLTGANRSLVGREAGRYRISRLDRRDLEQAGYVGLLVGLDRFDPAQGGLSSYARAWIRKEIQRCLAAGEFAIAIPAHLPGRLVALRSLSPARPADVDGAADAFDLSAEVVKGLRRLLTDMAWPAGHDGPTDWPDPERAVIANATAIACRNVVAELPARLGRVVRLYYGLDGSPHSARAIARHLAISDFTVRARLREALQILSSALQHWG